MKDSPADMMLCEIIKHMNDEPDSRKRMIMLNAIIWMIIDKTIGTKHDKVGILETTKFKIMGDEYGRFNSEFKG